MFGAIEKKPCGFESHRGEDRMNMATSEEEKLVIIYSKNLS